MPVPIFKEIPQPEIRHVPVDMHGMSWFEQISYDWSHAPLFDLAEDWIITTVDGLQLVFQKGFRTDLASIPRLLSNLIQPDGPLFLGSIVHDWGYGHGYLLSVYKPGYKYSLEDRRLYNANKEKFGNYMPVFTGMPQAFFDELLHDITESATGATLQAGEAYWVLRLFGWHAWNKYRALGPNAYGQDTLGLPGVGE